MTTPRGRPARRRNVRALLIRQQERAPTVVLPLPALLRSPMVLLLWAFVLTTVVAALLLGRIRVPRTARGMVVAAQATGDSLMPVLLLPSWSRQFVSAGELATVDTGSGEPVSVAIARVDSAPLNLTQARRWLDAPNVGASTIDTSMVVARLKPCTEPACLPLTAGVRYTAIARLGTRSLASFALPGS